MSNPIPAAVLDHILALQLTVAWAGEGLCEPRRLAWWQTDLLDPAGGGDLLARLLPRTAAWAGLEAVREAARRADAQARKQMAEPDHLRSLYFLGFDADERLDDRLRQLKLDGVAPAEALPFPIDLGAPFSRESLSAALRPGGVGGEHSVLPGGRQLKGAVPAALDQLVRRLVAALVPLADRYPLPFYRVPA